MSGVNFSHKGRVGILTLEGPPLNALGAAMRAALLRAVEAAATDPVSQALVITGAGRCFCAGGDLRELDREEPAPKLADVLDRIERLEKPVIATLHGPTLGAGFELAMAAHFRVALPNTRLGFPETRLGIMPNGGLTQRLPRTTGAEETLGLLLRASQMPAEVAAKLGIVDQVASLGNAPDVGVAFAQELLGASAAPRPTSTRKEGFADPAGFGTAIKKWRVRAGKFPYQTPGRIVDCVEAARLLPFEAGCAFEAAAFEDCRTDPAAHGLRHVFLSERRARDLSAKPAPPPSKVAIAGTGDTAVNLADLCLKAGIRVLLLAPDRYAASQLEKRMAARLDREVLADLIAAETRRKQLDLLTCEIQEDSVLTGQDFLIDATQQDEPGAELVLEDLRRRAAPDATIAMCKQGKATVPPGVIFLDLTFAEAPAKLVEVDTAGDEGKAGAPLSLLRKIGLSVVGRPDGQPGLAIGLLIGLRRGASTLISRGCSPYEIDRAMRSFGFSLGPFEWTDVLGLEVFSKPMADGPASDIIQRLERSLIAENRLGRGQGVGWYRYNGNLQGAPDEAILDLLDDASGSNEELSDDAIANGLLLEMTRDALDWMTAFPTLRPLDIDIAAVRGLGYPETKGGPMHAADAKGLLALQRAYQATGHGTPPELLQSLVRNGSTLASLNG
ncbi:MAG: enoyl-CoA hydratase-related protein [Pseudomonadota bacterium]